MKEKIEEIKIKILRYATRSKFQQNCASDWEWLKANGLTTILDEVHPYKVQEHPRSEEYVKARMLRCSNYSDFIRRYYAVYIWAREHGILDKLVEEVFPNRHQTRSENISAAKRTVTDEEVLADAKNYRTRQEWDAAGKLAVAAGGHNLYKIAHKRGLIAVACAHMPNLKGQHTNHPLKHTDQQILDSAKLFKHKSDWQAEHNGKYQVAIKRGLFEQATAHMAPKPNPYSGDYLVYACEFPDNYVYVGITFRSPQVREAEHRSRGPVFQHLSKYKNNFEYKILESKITDPAAVKGREKFWQEHYAAAKWIPLFSGKPGGLGTVKLLIWTVEAIIDDALQYQLKSEWRDGSQVAYKASKRLGCREQAMAHMPLRKLGVGKGVPKTEEARRKMSEKAKIRTANPEWRKQKSEQLKGWQMSPEQKAAHTEALKKYWTVERAKKNAAKSDEAGSACNSANPS